MIARLRAGALVLLVSAAVTPAHAGPPDAGTDSAAPTAAPAKASKPVPPVVSKAAPSAPVKPAPAASGTATPTAKPAATKIASGSAPAGTGVRTAVSTPAVTPVRTTNVKPVPTTNGRAPGPETASVEERVTYVYNALGRRDPFQPLVGGGYVGAEEQLAPPDVGGIKVVGIVWGAQDRFALVEDPRGNSMVLRQGDKVMNGTVDGLRRDKLIIKLATEGSTEYVEIPLTRKGDSNANR